MKWMKCITNYTMKRTGFIIFICLLPTLAVGGELESFTTDGCSSFPDGTSKQQSLWLNCCIRHDLAYWKGGTYEERLEADHALESCVSKVGQPDIAAIMLAGVRVGGSPYFPTPFRWGYGWPYFRGYKQLSKEEKQEVKAKLEQFKVMINQFAKEMQ